MHNGCIQPWTVNFWVGTYISRSRITRWSCALLKCQGQGRALKLTKLSSGGHLPKCLLGVAEPPLSHLFAILARQKFLETPRGQLQLPPSTMCSVRTIRKMTKENNECLVASGRQRPVWDLTARSQQYTPEKEYPSFTPAVLLKQMGGLQSRTVPFPNQRQWSGVLF